MSADPMSFDPQEELLWNLDEDWRMPTDSTVEQRKESAESESSQLSIESPVNEPQMVDATEPDEPVTRVEPSYSRRRLMRNRRGSDQPQEIEIPDGETMPIPSSVFHQKRSEEENTSVTRNTPLGLGPTEDEVWADFVADELPIPTGHVAPTSAMAPSEQSAKTSENLELIGEPDALVQNEHQETAAQETSSLEIPEPEPDVTPRATEVSAESSSKENNGSPSPSSKGKKASFSVPVLAGFELLASLLFLACLLVGGILAFQAFRSEVRGQANLYLQPDLPSSGKWVTITSAETYWRAPIKEGANADPVRQDVTMIPVIQIKLGQCVTPRGAVRVIFYNDKGVIAGDTVTQRFENHQFAPDPSSERAFSATTGFTNFGDQEAYRAHLVKPWTIRVYEGPDENAPSSEYRLLFTAPISTYIR